MPVPSQGDAARDRDGRILAGPTEGDPALRDAMEAADSEADAIRTRLRTTGPTDVEADGDIRQHLLAEERLHSVRRSAILRGPGAADGHGLGGTLYLTSERVVHLGQVTMSIQLTNITEASVAGERLLLSLGDGEGVAVDCGRPRAFRAELATAIRRARR